MHKFHRSAFKIKFMVQFFIGNLDNILIFDIKLYYFFDRKIGIINILKNCRNLSGTPGWNSSLNLHHPLYD